MAQGSLTGDHHHFIDKLAVINGFVTGFALYPQIFSILALGIENTLSSVTLWVILCNNVIWATYGVHRSLVSITAAGLLSGFAAAILLII